METKKAAGAASSWIGAKVDNSAETHKNSGVKIDPSAFDQDGLLIIKTANDWIKAAAKRPNPKKLWGDFWFEGELCCLFADTNVGKSIYAVQIASEIAKHRPIVYFDFELSDKQFQLRCTGEDGTLHQFPDNLYRVEVDPCKLDVAEFESVILNEIERATKAVSANVLVIDNLTWIASNVEKSDAAGLLMKQLNQLKRKNGWSILVISHTPKRIMTEPITQNNLSGSKKLANFFDSMFAIGYSAKDENLRYIKQIKIRYGKGEHRGNNVLVGEITKSGNLVQLHIIGCSTEAEHLKVETAKEKELNEERIVELRAKGLSHKAISTELGISQSSVQRFLKKMQCE